MKRKNVIERNIDMIAVVRQIAKRENDPELLSWANGVKQALIWILDNADDSNVSISLCNPAQEIEVIKEIEKMIWDD